MIKNKKQHESILKRIDRAYEPQQDVRKMCVQSSRFARVPGAQWEGGTNASEKINNRTEKFPKFEINKVATELNRIIAEYRNNRITVKFRPGDKAASEQLANKLNGLFRADYLETDGGEACDNAFDEAATSGFGCFRLSTQYVAEDDPTNEDMRISLEPIYDAPRSVWFDPDAKKYDKSDANYAFCLYSLTPEKFKAEYKKDAASLDLTMTEACEFDWNGTDVVYVAKFYEVRKESIELISYQQPITAEVVTYDSEQVEEVQSQLEEAGFEEVARRKVKKRRVYVSLIDAEGYLEEPTRIPGEHIPLIPVYGKRWFIDDIERVEGHIAKAMDAQRLYNLQISMLADGAAMDQGQTPIMDIEQIRGLESHWENRHEKRPSYLPLRNIKDPAGNIVSPANVAGYTQPPVLNQALAALLQQTSSDIQEVTGSSQAMQQMPSNVSQQTVNDLMNRADMASFIYLDNMGKSLKRAGQVWLSMAREVYGTDREVRIVNEDGSDDITLMHVELKDDNTGRIGMNDLSTGRYDVTVDVGPSYSSRRDSTVASLTQLLNGMLPQDPQRPIIMGVIIDNMDGEGLDDFKEYNRRQLLSQGIVQPKNAKEQQVVQQAQQAAQNQQDPNVLLAQAQMVAAQAEAQKASNETAQVQIKAFTAQQDAMESQANTVYKLAQAKNIDRNAVLDAVKLLHDVLTSQQQEIPNPQVNSQSPIN
jgi:hypothetical protein